MANGSSHSARHNPNAWETDDGIDADTDLMLIDCMT